MEKIEARPDNVSPQDSVEPPSQALFDSAYSSDTASSSRSLEPATDSLNKTSSTLPNLEITDNESATIGAVFTSDTGGERAPKPGDKPGERAPKPGDKGAERAPKPADKAGSTKLSPEHAEVLKKFETTPATTKALKDAAKETVKALKEGLEGKLPASDAAKAKSVEALNKLGDAVRGLKNPDGTRMNVSDRAKLVEALLTRGMGDAGMKDYQATRAPVRPRSGEYQDFAIEKRNEQVGDRSMRITVPFNKFGSTERSDSAAGDVGIKTKTSYKTLDSWVKPRK